MTTRTAQTILCLAAGATVLAQTACSRTPPPVAAAKPSTTTNYPPKPVGQVLGLELAGTPPRDTALNVPRNATRVVVLRHGAPDNITFAEVTFPAGVFHGGGDSVRVSLRPRPGVYGLDIEAAAPFDSVRLTFEYAVHFSAPAEARTIFGSDVNYERALAIGRLQGDSVVFLPSTRPASDNLSTVIPSAGSYLVAAPK